MKRSFLSLAIVAALVPAAALPSSALADQYYFANTVSLTSGNGYSAPGYRGDIEGVSGRGTPTAYTGVWVVNSSNTRISADQYCDATHGGPSCTAAYFWGPAPAGPSGYGRVHNHGNGSPNNFKAFVQFQ